MLLSQDIYKNIFSEEKIDYFEKLMADYANQPVPILFDFNMVITNLNKMDKSKALELVAQLRSSIAAKEE